MWTEQMAEPGRSDIPQYDVDCYTQLRLINFLQYVCQLVTCIENTVLRRRCFLYPVHFIMFTVGDTDKAQVALWTF